MKKREFFKYDDVDENVEMQSKLSFNGVLKSYGNNDSYIFKHNEVFMDKPIYLRFAVLGVSKLLNVEAS